MKKVKIKVEGENGVSSIEVQFTGDTMPESLDSFIAEHIGGRPKDRG